jgi:hypothetical protein
VLEIALSPIPPVPFLLGLENQVEIHPWAGKNSALRYWEVSFVIHTLLDGVQGYRHAYLKVRISSYALIILPIVRVGMRALYIAAKPQVPRGIKGSYQQLCIEGFVGEEKTDAEAAPRDVEVLGQEYNTL